MSNNLKHTAFISLGSNLGDRNLFLRKAIQAIEEIPCKIIQHSKIIETKALDFIDQPDFLNCILVIKIDLSPIELLDALQSIENKLGRIKRFDKGPREIDLDILTYDNLIFKNERLVLPHHSIKTRPFIKELLEDLK
ncbi:MAG TPA: 2-amino-4-hydroxy-6-hydroxymethyldihydropteridine diphosphokinase [Leptospiraceae bacterium]|nr:2-amino-4-hydroxy-6-hydroxymethyldihydropteridine diphosphokinase [Leptospiraceae bacterium]HMW07743.1 2-amino-4-hydroxy-6-hydroxymethyldihydropteridine diphosphokinase [Leptospiraceae bacterium]HMX31987.1 2-amino-4-hydroxy-6-hydroxymethyldihydropteridine diphosphokinase [Leptospiraceae bacterium]HMY33409.1 2-amino-4-hydroxy-6-hydroxymethyldihydropteridine diphosphokinase [Leptospiraceae bacterium]HMZ64783.1 2-amino-4-hydroxy-6-hydroxymethyldihydropteridine diphosphokinase [Leptospiraceae ba